MKTPHILALIGSLAFLLIIGLYFLFPGHKSPAPKTATVPRVSPSAKPAPQAPNAPKASPGSVKKQAFDSKAQVSFTVQDKLLTVTLGKAVPANTAVTAYCYDDDPTKVYPHSFTSFPNGIRTNVQLARDVSSNVQFCGLKDVKGNDIAYALFNKNYVELKDAKSQAEFALVTASSIAWLSGRGQDAEKIASSVTKGTGDKALALPTNIEATPQALASMEKNRIYVDEAYTNASRTSLMLRYSADEALVYQVYYDTLKFDQLVQPLSK